MRRSMSMALYRRPFTVRLLYFGQRRFRKLRPDDISSVNSTVLTLSEYNGSLRVRRGCNHSANPQWWIRCANTSYEEYSALYFIDVYFISTYFTSVKAEHTFTNICKNYSAFRYGDEFCATLYMHILIKDEVKNKNPKTCTRILIIYFYSY